MKLLLAYFSATGNTRNIARVLGDRFTKLGADVELLDITSHAKRAEKIDLDPYPAVVFGAPVHSRRAPRVFREWLGRLDGRDRRAAMFFTFGGFGVDPTHLSTQEILKQQRFQVTGSAQFLGAHTFNLGGWKAMEGRPDDSDMNVAREYAARVYPRLRGADPGRLAEMEPSRHSESELDDMENMRFKVLTQVPTLGGEACSLCLLCEESCPTGAMDAESGQADRDRCIACLACVNICPEDVLKINDMSDIWTFKLGMEKTTAEQLQTQRSRIYL